jgi:hypothetical protein
MTKLILNGDLRRQLPDLTHPFEVCDEMGKTVGCFIPGEPSVQDAPEKIQAGPAISREEIERRKQKKGKTYTTAEVLGFLEEL